MSKSTFMRLLTAATVLALGASTAAIAQNNYDLQSRKEIRRTDLTGAPGMEVIVSTIEMKPGDVAPLHHHDGIEVAYIFEGAMIRRDDGEIATLQTGTSIMNLRDVKHAGFTNVDTKTLKFFNVLIVEKNKPLFVFPPK
jgi:quercetin dioxygenase-like cupin family protein